MKSIWGQAQRHLKWAVGWRWRFLLTPLVILLSTLILTTPAEAQPLVVPLPLPTAQVGVSYSATLVATGGTPPYTNWTRTGGALPAGLTLDPATGVISGTPTLAGTYSFFVTVTDATPLTSAQQGFFITVAEKPITFTSTYLPQATEGSSYSASITVTGGKPPYTFSLSSGTLPPGLTLDSINGIISGTPTKGTAGTYVFTITATDSSASPLSAQRSFSLVVKKGFFDSVITVSSTLAAGETNVYVDGRLVAQLRGGQTTRQTFAVGTNSAITVSPLVSHPTRADIRFIADEDKIVVSELSPDATFTYTPEYFVDLKTDPPQVTTLTGANWFKEGDSIKSTAPAQIEGTSGAQYRFSYWLLPNGDKLMGADLSWIVTAAGKVTATYDTYYLLTVTSPQGRVDGGGWYRAGTTARWSVNPPEVPMSGILGFFRGNLKPESATGNEVMDAPKTLTVAWNPDYTMPGILISLLALFLIGGAFGLYRLLNPPPPKPVTPILAPAPPTIVLIEGAQKTNLATTKEQLVEQFRQLLEKYEDEVKSTIKTEGLPEAKLIPEAQRLAPPEEEAQILCGHTSKKLLRTVVGNWHKVEEKIVPPSKKAGTKGVSIRTIWARDIYKEWEVSVCSLPGGHSGSHHGTTTKGYTLQDTATEELAYSAKQKTTPPKPHFTDELSVVDVAPHQIMPSDQTTLHDEAITPDEIIPPDQPTES